MKCQEKKIIQKTKCLIKNKNNMMTFTKCSSHYKTTGTNSHLLNKELVGKHTAKKC